MFDSYLAESLLQEHMAEVRRREARRLLLGTDRLPRQRYPGLIRRLVQAVSIPALKRVVERRASQ
jgi:hypothetical protein